MVFFLALMCLLPMWRPAYAVSDAQFEQVGKLALEEHIRPRFKDLNEKTVLLEGAVKSYCAGKPETTRTNLEGAFRQVLQSFSMVEHLRFGPLVKKNRLERLAFWPDHKGIGLKQVRKVLRIEDKTVLTLSGLQGKSVAVQGLTALEYLMYGTGKDKFGKGHFRCQYAEIISQNLSMIAGEIVAGWGGGAAYTKIYLNPNEQSEIFMDRNEVMRTLFISFLTGFKLVKDFKIMRPMGKSIERARPKRAAFWRSKSAIMVTRGNVTGIKELFETAFAGLVSDVDPSGDEGVLDEFTHVEYELGRMKMPLMDIVRDKDQRKKLNDLKDVLTNIRKDGAGAFASAAGMSMGFNALDGD